MSVEESLHDEMRFRHVVVQVDTLVLRVDEDHLVDVLVQVLEEIADLADLHRWNDAFLAAESHELVAHHLGPDLLVFDGPLSRSVVEFLAVGDPTNLRLRNGSGA